MKYIACRAAGGSEVGAKKSGDPSTSYFHHFRLVTKPGEKLFFGALQSLLIACDSFDEEVGDAGCVFRIVEVHTMEQESQ